MALTSKEIDDCIDKRYGSQTGGGELKQLAELLLGVCRIHFKSYERINLSIDQWSAVPRSLCSGRYRSCRFESHATAVARKQASFLASDVVPSLFWMVCERMVAMTNKPAVSGQFSPP